MVVGILGCGGMVMVPFLSTVPKRAMTGAVWPFLGRNLARRIGNLTKTVSV